MEWIFDAKNDFSIYVSTFGTIVITITAAIVSLHKTFVLIARSMKDFSKFFRSPKTHFAIIFLFVSSYVFAVILINLREKKLSVDELSSNNLTGMHVKDLAKYNNLYKSAILTNNEIFMNVIGREHKNMAVVSFEKDPKTGNYTKITDMELENIYEFIDLHKDNSRIIIVGLASKSASQNYNIEMATIRTKYLQELIKVKHPGVSCDRYVAGEGVVVKSLSKAKDNLNYKSCVIYQLPEIDTSVKPLEQFIESIDVKIKTSPKAGSGTFSNAYITISGKKYPMGKNFKAGSQVRLNLKVQKGTLALQHFLISDYIVETDGTGAFPRWLIERIEIVANGEDGPLEKRVFPKTGISSGLELSRSNEWFIIVGS